MLEIREFILDFARHESGTTTLNAVLKVLPEDFVLTEQALVAESFKIDLFVNITKDQGSFAVEADRVDHYLCKTDHLMYRKIPGSREAVLKQLERDRFVEKHCLTLGISLFRVPYSESLFRAKSTDKIEWSANLILHRANEDIGAHRARVHYLDYEQMYRKIDVFAEDNQAASRLNVTAGAEGDFQLTSVQK
jgi:hypothetical protein